MLVETNEISEIGHSSPHGNEPHRRVKLSCDGLRVYGGEISKKLRKEVCSSLKSPKKSSDESLRRRKLLLSVEKEKRESRTVQGV